ncbi:CLUMA_CG000959, isoform A [Clunio marinus]|uniref:CLUMA_CG000959, isoform A n=1 Tax=Clunio marinus TaxID=568069 RepID=A0A1J1HL15_9DIPT|nr:CLUMA_CG000959, isoform A [Clunio marinus]
MHQIPDKCYSNVNSFSCGAEEGKNGQIDSKLRVLRPRNLTTITSPLPSLAKHPVLTTFIHIFLRTDEDISIN